MLKVDGSIFLGRFSFFLLSRHTQIQPDRTFHNIKALKSDKQHFFASLKRQSTISKWKLFSRDHDERPLVRSKETKFERGAAQAGPAVGLDFPFPLL